MCGKFVIYLTIFRVFLGVSSQQTTLECYDCDPQHEPEKCINPDELSPNFVNCNKELQTQSNSTLICLSAYIKSPIQNKTGIYRGCKIQKDDVTNYCDYFKEESGIQNFTVIDCASCNNDRCNIQLFNKDNGKISGGNDNRAICSSIILSIIIWHILY